MVFTEHRKKETRSAAAATMALWKRPLKYDMGLKFYYKDYESLAQPSGSPGNAEPLKTKYMETAETDTGNNKTGSGSPGKSLIGVSSACRLEEMVRSEGRAAARSPCRSCVKTGTGKTTARSVPERMPGNEKLRRGLTGTLLPKRETTRKASAK